MRFPRVASNKIFSWIAHQQHPFFVIRVAIPHLHLVMAAVLAAHPAPGSRDHSRSETRDKSYFPFRSSLCFVLDVRHAVSNATSPESDAKKRECLFAPYPWSICTITPIHTPHKTLTPRSPRASGRQRSRVYVIFIRAQLNPHLLPPSQPLSAAVNQQPSPFQGRAQLRFTP
jgi:hypothetical protein